MRSILLSLLVVVGFASCFSHAPSPTGTLVGGIVSVPPDGGQLKSGHYGGFVEVLNGAKVVAKAQLTSPDALLYRFHLPPGQYRLRGTVGDQNLRICGGRARITSGRVVHVDTTCPIP